MKNTKKIALISTLALASAIATTGIVSADSVILPDGSAQNVVNSTEYMATLENGETISNDNNVWYLNGTRVEYYKNVVPIKTPQATPEQHPQLIPVITQQIPTQKTPELPQQTPVEQKIPTIQQQTPQSTPTYVQQVPAEQKIPTVQQQTPQTTPQHIQKTPNEQKVPVSTQKIPTIKQSTTKIETSDTNKTQSKPVADTKDSSQTHFEVSADGKITPINKSVKVNSTLAQPTSAKKVASIAPTYTGPTLPTTGSDNGNLKMIAGIALVGTAVLATIGGLVISKKQGLSDEI